jgi:hypothetical protein
LLRYAQSDNPRHRDDATFLLRIYAGHSPDAIKMLRQLTTDPNAGVRQNAHAHLFQVTNKLPDFLPYLLVQASELSHQPALKPDASQEEQGEKTMRILQWYTGACMIAGWVEERPEEVCDVLVAMLRAESPKTRLAATEFLKETAMKLKGPIPPEPPKFKDFEPRKCDPKKYRNGLEIIARSAAIRDRLKTLAEQDPDAGVRKEADLTIWIIKTADR